MANEGSEGFGGLVKRWLVSGLGVWLGAYFVDGISYDNNVTIVIAVLLLGLFSAVLKPILVLFTLPFVLLTLGLGILFINALLYLLVGNLLEGFTVDSFWDAFLGALFISILNLIFSGWISGGKSAAKVRVGGNKASSTRRKVKAKDDVIDI